ncbi:hypothetical protein ABTI15_19725, partial [Acinetobacter baumannii]
TPRAGATPHPAQASQQAPHKGATQNKFSRIAGTGSFLPPHRVSNQELVDRLARDGIQSSDDWIVERTGIRARHFAAPDVTSSQLGLQACLRA